MYLRVQTFDVAVAYVDGFNAAMCGAVLEGFREWLITRANDGNNLSWSQLVLLNLDPSTRDDPQRSIEGLFGLLEQFLALRQHGLRRIFLLYEDWLRRQSWYTPASPAWIARGE